MSIGHNLSGELWRDPFAPRASTPRTTLRFGLVAGAHVALIAAVAGLAATPELRTATRELVVRLIETQPPRPEVRPPQPVPVKPQALHQPAPPPPIMVAAATAAAPSDFAVASQPPTPRRIDVAPAPLPVSAARFDADYLHNPKPVYPIFSRRQNEEGKVQLRVRVGADGAALEVEVKQSSGFPRLDAAARDAVLKWRFVPAKRGDEAVESWVGVPIVFSLEH